MSGIPYTLTFLLFFLHNIFRGFGLSPIHVEQGHFVDNDGRVLLFRGINSVVKQFPWYDTKMLDPARQRNLAEWGFNAVRLGTMWSGVEPQEGQVNETYVGILKEIVGGLADNGIYSYLDMHQDVLKTTGGYAGIPDWLSAKLEPSPHAYPWPMYNKTGFTTWACGYFTEDISNSFQQLYTEHSQEFAWVWRAIAERFKGDPSILGYELMNEPWTGDLYQDASLLLPGNAGYELLEPFYNAAHNAIRQVDDETIIFWEPVTYAYFVNAAPNILLDGVLDAFLKSHNFTDFLPVLKLVCGDMVDQSEPQKLAPVLPSLLNMLGEAALHRFNEVGVSSSRPSTLGPGFTAPPGGMEYLNRTAMSWHYYCWALGGGNNEGYDPSLRAVCDDFLGPLVFDTVHARAEELGGSATMLTEFGICYPRYDEPDIEGTIECNFVMDQADSHFQSWSYWDTAGGGVMWDEDGKPDLNRVKVFSRPYPQATAGIPTKLHYDTASRRFSYEYLPNPSLGVPTVVFVSPLLYSEGYQVELSPNLSWKVDESSPDKILVEATDSSPATIVIVPTEKLQLE